MIYKTHLGRVTENPLTPAMVINSMTHINYGHKFLYDYETIMTLGLDAGYSSVQKIEYNEMADREMAGFFKKKDINYHAETEVYVLGKS